MKKILFSDRFGLTKAVLEGRKTMTRRIAEKNLVEDMDGELCWYGEFKKPRYKVGEVVAVAQAYKDTWGNPDFLFGDKPGWTNKMFVSAELMPHQIRITSVRIEHLQDICDDDCLREGIYKQEPRPGVPALYAFETRKDKYWWATLEKKWYMSPREAFAALIDKVSGKGTWQANPWVFVYEFELVKED